MTEVTATDAKESITSSGEKVRPKLNATAGEAKCLAISILGRIVSDEWEALGEAKRDGTFPEMVKAYIAGADTEYFNMRFPDYANSGILEDVVDTYIQRILRRSESTEPSSSDTLGKPEYSKDPILEAAAKSQMENPEALNAAFKQYMELKGPPRVPRPTINRVVE